MIEEPAEVPALFLKSQNTSNTVDLVSHTINSTTSIWDDSVWAVPATARDTIESNTITVEEEQSLHHDLPPLVDESDSECADHGENRPGCSSIDFEHMEALFKEHYVQDVGAISSDAEPNEDTQNTAVNQTCAVCLKPSRRSSFDPVH